MNLGRLGPLPTIKKEVMPARLSPKYELLWVIFMVLLTPLVAASLVTPLVMLLQANLPPATIVEVPEFDVEPSPEFPETYPLYSRLSAMEMYYEYRYGPRHFGEILLEREASGTER